MSYDITETATNMLKKCPTYVRYANEFGQCLGCGEMTAVLETCCDLPLIFNGDKVTTEDLWNTIEDELKQYVHDIGL